MEDSKKYSRPTSDRDYVKKVRKCLKCGQGFESSWSGERVCRSCKSTHVWRDGNNALDGWAA